MCGVTLTAVSLARLADGDDKVRTGMDAAKDQLSAFKVVYDLIPDCQHKVAVAMDGPSIELVKGMGTFLETVRIEALCHMAEWAELERVTRVSPSLVGS